MEYATACHQRLKIDHKSEFSLNKGFKGLQGWNAEKECSDLGTIYIDKSTMLPDCK